MAMMGATVAVDFLFLSDSAARCISLLMVLSTLSASSSEVEVAGMSSEAVVAEPNVGGRLKGESNCSRFSLIACSLKAFPKFDFFAKNLYIQSTFVRIQPFGIILNRDQFGFWNIRFYTLYISNDEFMIS